MAGVIGADYRGVSDEEVECGMCRKPMSRCGCTRPKRRRAVSSFRIGGLIGFFVSMIKVVGILVLIGLGIWILLNVLHINKKVKDLHEHGYNSYGGSGGGGYDHDKGYGRGGDGYGKDVTVDNQINCPPFPEVAVKCDCVSSTSVDCTPDLDGSCHVLFHEKFNLGIPNSGFLQNVFMTLGAVGQAFGTFFSFFPYPPELIFHEEGSVRVISPYNNDTFEMQAGVGAFGFKDVPIVAPISQLYNVEDDEKLTFSWVMKSNITGVEQHPFGYEVHDPFADPRLVIAGPILVDAKFGTTVCFFFTPNQIFAFHDKNPGFVGNAGTTFNFGRPIANYTTGQKVKFEGEYNRKAGTYKWFIDGDLKLTVDNIGLIQPSQNGDFIARVDPIEDYSVVDPETFFLAYLGASGFGALRNVGSGSDKGLFPNTFAPTPVDPSMLVFNEVQEYYGLVIDQTIYDVKVTKCKAH